MPQSKTGVSLRFSAVLRSRGGDGMDLPGAVWDAGGRKAEERHLGKQDPG